MFTFIVETLPDVSPRCREASSVLISNISENSPIFKRMLIDVIQNVWYLPD